MPGLIDRLGRWFRHSETGQAIAARIGAGYIRLVTRTTRWQIIGEEHREAVLADGRGFIAAIWHGRLFMSASVAPPGRYNVAMISNNRDGDLISAVVRRFGVISIRGSTYDRIKQVNKGGVEALKAAQQKIIDRHAIIAITPDGPRGPRMRALPGVSGISAITQCAVVPVAFSTRRGRVMKSWDRFLLPWPLGRGVIIYGKPLAPPSSTDDTAIAEHAREVEERINDITHQADDLCGRARVLPDPATAA